MLSWNGNDGKLNTCIMVIKFLNTIKTLKRHNQWVKMRDFKVLSNKEADRSIPFAITCHNDAL